MFLIFDTETTGLPSKTTCKTPFYNLENYDSCRMVQLAWCFLNDDGIPFTEVYSMYINPTEGGFTVTPETFCHSVSGLTNDFLICHGVSRREIFQTLKRQIDTYNPRFLVGHNCMFDIQVVMSEIYRFYGQANRPWLFWKNKNGYPKPICTLKLARECRLGKIYPYCICKNMKLDTLWYSLIDDKNTINGFHLADNDVRANINIFEHLLKVHPKIKKQIHTSLQTIDFNALISIYWK